MRYGIIGTSWITEAFIQGAMISSSMKLSAVYSRSRDKGAAFVKKYGDIPVYTELAGMLESGLIDALYIASPNSLHYEQSKAALISGIHVICEKPVTVTAAQFRELSALAEQNGLVYMEAMKTLYQPSRKVIHQALREIGEIHTAHIDFSQLSSKYHRFIKGEHLNVFDPVMGGGCLMDLGVYCVSAAIDFFGLPQSTSASAGFMRCGADYKRPCDVYGSALFRYQERDVTLTYSKVGQSASGSEIIGTSGTLLIDSISCYTGVTIVKNGKGKELVGTIPRDEVMGYEAAAFARYAANISAYRNELDMLGHMTADLCDTLEAMRKSAGIVM